MLTLDFEGTFDTASSLSGMYLWLLFGYLSVMLNCDLQRFIQSHPLVMHLVGIVAFFFLFTVLDSNNKNDIKIIWIKTLIVYGLFILSTKSKWYFVVPVLVLLLVDQSMKKDLSFEKAKGHLSEEAIQRNEERVRKVTNIIQYVIYAMIITGTLHYVYLQKLEYKSEFRWSKFFFGITKCKSTMPRYSMMK